MAHKRAAGLPRLLLCFVLVLSLVSGCTPSGSQPAPSPSGGGAAPGAGQGEPSRGQPGEGQTDGGQPGGGAASGGGAGEPATSPAAIVAAVDAWMEYLTLEEKVGQLFWVGLPGPEVTYESEQLLAEGHVGGYILFARQGSDPAVLSRLNGALQEAAAARERTTPGLIVSVDHEGGLVQRFGPPFTQWPGNMAIGATGSESYAAQAGQAMARELRAIGVNMNLAPDADVNNNPANPVIGTRSFGEDPAQVARLAAAMVQGLQSEGVSAVAKHFPGHGDTAMDSHFDLPLVDHPWERLDQVELVPFRAAIDAGADAIMTAHIIFPAVATDGLPATLSPQVLTGLLKEQMGYQGAVLTDAMDVMKAITDLYGVEQGLIMAIQAGADAVLVTESFGIQRALYGLLLKAVKEGEIPESRIEDAARRVLMLKARRGLLPALPPPGAAAGSGGTAAPTTDSPPAGIPGAPLASTPTPDLSQIGTPEHLALAEQIGADALTLVRSAHLPLVLGPEERVLVIGPGYATRLNRTDGIVTPLGASIKAQHENTWEVTLDRRPASGAIDNARRMAEQAAALVYGVTDGHRYPEHQAFIAELVATGKPVIVVGLGMPYELTAVPQIETYVAAYGYKETNLKGIGPLLFGKAEAKGRLPVSIPDLYPAGHGLSQ